MFTKFMEKPMNTPAFAEAATRRQASQSLRRLAEDLIPNK